jgi:Uncharacterized conserved protein
MSSREKILYEIAKNKPTASSLPEIIVDKQYNSSSLVNQFLSTLNAIDAIAISVENIQTIKDDIKNGIEEGNYIVNTIEALGNINQEVDIITDNAFLESVHIAYISGTIGVAENGAIWLEENKMVNRLLPFICQNLVIVLDANKIVADMHEAYDKIKIDKNGYGVFIAGPSKTADIEQSLVVGAHGPISLKVYVIINNKL